MVPRWSQRYPGEKITDFNFTDHIVELGESFTKRLNSSGLARPDSKEVDLRVNTTKAQLISFNIPHASLELDKEDIENFGDFHYLSSYIA